VADALAEVRFPDAIWMELEALRAEDSTRFNHAVWTALVSARLFGCALGSAPGLSRILGGALVHDLGMRFCAPRLRFKRDHLTHEDALSLEDHPLLGALLLASVLGDAPAVHLALLHHVRAGFGYPKMQRVVPLRGLDLIAVASAFSAMVAPRSFRPDPFSPRGAVDQLLDEANAGHFDARAVRLLVHCMRGGAGVLPELRLRPEVNFHGLGSIPIAQSGS
jgi:HD-GYP domain-containing protein (c-di-GMP phosphodiesterase class II)